MLFGFRPAHQLVKACLPAFILAASLTACTTGQEISPSEGRDSTLSDAQSKARGRHARAPSQLQLGFGDNKRQHDSSAGSLAVSTEAPEAPASAAVIRPLRTAKTFLGTLPCTPASDQCVAMRTTLTMAPTGEYRARSQPLGPDSQIKGPARYDQGCWEAIGEQPWRIVLRSLKQGSNASFTFLNDNVLRVDRYNDTRPTLDYRLTRQQDIDGIHELDESESSEATGTTSTPVGSTPINCQNREDRP